MTGSDSEESPARLKRWLAAALVGFAGCVLIWLATPYNNYVIENSFIADSYLPIGAMFIILVLTLGVNPAIRAISPALALDSRQMGLALGIMLVGSSISGQGLLRMLPWSLGQTLLDLANDPSLVRAYKSAGVRQCLFPDRFDPAEQSFFSQYFATGLPENVSVPWGAWVSPLLWWGCMLLACWLMMIGLAMILLPQWRDNERLAFPLLQVYEAVTGGGEADGTQRLTLSSRGFWICTGAVLVHYLFVGLNAYFPDRIPAISLRWNLSGLFQEGPLAQLQSGMTSGGLTFSFIGITFFMPNRISFSIWFFTVAYQLYRAFKIYYFPPHYDFVVDCYRLGAVVALAIGAIWLGRNRWAAVLSGVLRPGTLRNSADRQAGVMFGLGCAGMLAWLIWAGVSWAWSLAFIVFAVAVTITITRMVAETGIPLVRVDIGHHFPLIRSVPASWLTPLTLYFSYFMMMFFPSASRVNATGMAIHAMGLHKEPSPRLRKVFAYGLVAILAAGLAVGGAAHVWVAYQHATPLSGQSNTVNWWGRGQLGQANYALRDFVDGRLNRPVYNEVSHTLAGTAIAGLLQAASVLLPRWPFHPVGFLMMNTWFAFGAWPSIFLGWVLKLALLKYGGSRAYRAALPAFLGLIVGETMASIIWSVVPAIVTLSGGEYRFVRVMPL